jgi:hypothetical protein
MKNKSKHIAYQVSSHLACSFGGFASTRITTVATATTVVAKK